MKNAHLTIVVFTAGVVGIGLAIYSSYNHGAPQAQVVSPSATPANPSELTVAPPISMTDVQAQALARKTWVEKGGAPLPASARVTIVRAGDVITVTFFPETSNPEPKPGGDFLAQVDIDAKSGVVTAMRTSA